MQIVVNGDPLEVDESLSLMALLARVGKAPEHVAVERNGAIVEPAQFSSLRLEPADRLEIVHFVGGG